MSFLTNKETTFDLTRQRWFSKRVDKYMITLKGGTIYYNGVQRIVSFFPNAKFNDIEYIKILTHNKTPYKVFKLCWGLYVQDISHKDIVNIRIEGGN